jgi:hypothetical protein
MSPTLGSTDMRLWKSREHPNRFNDIEIAHEIVKTAAAHHQALPASPPRYTET